MIARTMAMYYKGRHKDVTRRLFGISGGPGAHRVKIKGMNNWVPHPLRGVGCWC